MKNRSNVFLVVSGCLLCIAALLLVISLSPLRFPLTQESYPVGTTQNAPSTEATSIDTSGEAPQTVQEMIDALPGASNTEKQELARMFEIRDSEEYQEFLNAHSEKIEDTYEQTGKFDFSFQDYFDFFASQGMPEVDFAATMLDMFREYFPTGAPEDYEPEMAARFILAFWEAPGSRSEALLEAYGTVLAEPDFSAWTYGHFQGNVGEQIQWLEEQAALATAMGRVELSTDSPPAGGTEFANENIPDIGIERTRLSESKKEDQGQDLETLVLPADAPAPFTPERVSSIRETLNSYGSSEGMRHLLETDPEGALWLLRNFDAVDLGTWKSEPNPETRLISIPEQQDVPSWRKE